MICLTVPISSSLKNIFLLILFSILPFKLIFAEPVLTYHETVRSLGMGGVRIPSTEDAGILLYNPAGLAFTKGINLTVFNLNPAFNGAEIYSSIQNVGPINGLSSLSAFYGKNIWVGGEGYVAYATPYFGLAAYDYISGTFQMHNPAFPQMKTNYFNDYGFILGLGFPLSDYSSVGFNLKRLDRTGGPVVISSDKLMSLNMETLASQYQNEGTAWGFDLGFMFRAPAPFSPTFSVNWQDIGSTSFTLSKGTVAPDLIRDNLIFAITMNGDIPLLAWSGGIEYRHINNNNEPLGKKMHLGTELSLTMFDLRAGVGQGYTSYGIGIDLFLLQVDLAYYTVELGAYPGQSPDKRINVGLSFDLGFDPSFTFLQGGGKKRKVKQRR